MVLKHTGIRLYTYLYTRVSEVKEAISLQQANYLLFL